MIKTEVLPSPIEQINTAGSGNYKGPEMDMFRKPVIVTVRCKKCTTEEVRRI